MGSAPEVYFKSTPGAPQVNLPEYVTALLMQREYRGPARGLWPPRLIFHQKGEPSHATLELFRLRCFLSSAVPGDLRLSGLLRRQLLGAEDARLDAGKLPLRCRHQSHVA